MKYSVLAFYLFPKEPVENPSEEVKWQREQLSSLDGRGRIYISEQGINAQLSLPNENVARYLEALKGHPIWKEAEIKIHLYHEHAFAKLGVRYRRQLVAIDTEVDMSLRGEYLTPAEWAERIEKPEAGQILIDVRNDYEWEVGHFEGSTLPPLKTFREFPAYARALKEKIDPETTPVLMCCTGGIRCEVYSALMLKEGFKKIYQLHGGIIQYGLDMGKKHWNGKLFVFDDRLAVPISKEEPTVIAKCLHCATPADTYYNCANMDCNELFVSCRACAEKMSGCCRESCCRAPRVRAFEAAETPHPYRKLSHEEKCALASK